MTRVLLISHEPEAAPALIGRILGERGVHTQLHTVLADPSDPDTDFPDPTGFDAVISFGSFANAYDETAQRWVEPETALVRSIVDQDVPYLGVCFGGQLLATALGGSVLPAPFEEIGWIEIEPVAGVEHPVPTGPWFQWHLDVFTPPADATVLATSPAGAQAFRLRDNLALQFHPEVNPAVLQEWMITDRDQLRECGVDPDELLERTARETTKARTRAEAVVRAFLDSVNADDHITTSNRSRYFATTDTVTMWLENSLPDTEIGDEEMYQHVSFRVTSNGVTSPWTAWEDSPEQQFSK